MNESKLLADEPAKNRRILVIDDNRAIHDDFRKILSVTPAAHTGLDEDEALLFDESRPVTPAVSFDLSSAYQGQEGLALLQDAVQKQRPYAVAFVDIRMPPGWDGVETTLRLWEVDPDLQIVICTAYSDYSWDEMIEKVGRSDRLLILKKPFDTVEVMQLANALSEKWWLLQRVRTQLSKLEVMVADRTRELQTANTQLQLEVKERTQTEVILQFKTEQLQVITKAMVTFLQSGDWSATSATILRGALHQTESPCGFVGAISEHGKLRILAQEGLEWDPTVPQPGGVLELPALTGYLAALITTGTTCITNQAGDHQLLRELPAVQPPLEHFLGAPILSGSTAVGIIWVANRAGGYTAVEQEKIEILTRAAGVLYDSYRRQERESVLEAQLRQSQKVEAIGQLAGGVAHDFNNILTAIMGYSSLILSRAAATDTMRPNVQEILKAANRAAALTKQLLAFSRRQILEPKIVNPNDIVVDLMKMLRRMIDESIELTHKHSSGLSQVKVDPGQLEQVVLNLAVNARDAMPQGGKLVIETSNVVLDTAYAVAHEGVVPGPYVMLAVSDNGTGMSPEVQGRIFEPFFTTKEPGKGTGLGLATCYGIVKQSGGHITVDSEIGRGTTFQIYLPQIEGPATIAPNPEETSDIPNGHETILLTEDEPALRELAGIILRSMGYTILEAANGIEALKVAQTHPNFDLLVTDVVMPQMGGKELADRLHTTNPRLKVLFSSGYTANTIVHGGVLDEGIAFLPKPYTPNTLARKIREVLDAPARNTN